MPNRELAPWTGSRGLTPFARDPFTAFRREMDRLFDGFFAPAEGRSFAAPAAFGTDWPSIDVHETDQAYTVTAEVPGLEEKDVDVQLSDNALILSGEKRQEHKQEDGGRTYEERFYGRFRRALPLDTEVDADKVEATFKNGVLKVTLPKNPNAKERARKIEVRSQH